MYAKIIGRFTILDVLKNYLMKKKHLIGVKRMNRNYETILLQ